MSCLLSLFNAKHCAVNTLLDFKHFPVDCISQSRSILTILWGSFVIFQTNDRKLFVRGRICCLLCQPWDPIDLSCWKARLNKLVTAGGVGSRGNGPQTQCFIRGDNFGLPQKNPIDFETRSIWNRIYIYNQISVIDILKTTFLRIIHPDSRIA
jgi:hypothetical protein